MGIDVVTLALAKGYTDEKIRDAALGDAPLDTSLTKNGQAADAKAVGDRLQSLSEEISDRVIAPTTAAVGQTIVAKAVDENGKPTEWETVDFPEVDLSSYQEKLTAGDNITIEGNVISATGGSGIAVTGATVGQTIRVAAVDDDGVPTAWEPVDFPSGGGSVNGEEWETIADFTAEKVCGSVVFNTDLNGLPFALKKAIVEINSTMQNGSWTTFDPIYINGKSKTAFITNGLSDTADSYLWHIAGKPSTVTTETFTGYLYARWEFELNENAVIVGKGRTSTLFEDADGNYHGTNGVSGGWSANTENFFISKDRFEGGITEIMSRFAYSGINVGMHFVIKGVRM